MIRILADNDKQKAIAVDAVLATAPCTECNGEGWIADHTVEHYHNAHDPDYSRYGCPVQVACEKCNGAGHCC